jgi:hypothetical protein
VRSNTFRRRADLKAGVSAGMREPIADGCLAATERFDRLRLPLPGLNRDGHAAAINAETQRSSTFHVSPSLMTLRGNASRPL